MVGVLFETDPDVGKKQIEMCYAAVLHELALAKNKLAMISDLNDKEFQDLSWETKQEVLDHPRKMANMLKKSHIVPKNIIEVILQHHESVDGKGFPNRLLEKDISRFSSIFIVAHTFVDQLYKNHFNMRIVPDILEEMRGIFRVGNFTGIVSSLDKVMNEGNEK